MRLAMSDSRKQTEDALRELLMRRQAGSFISLDEGERRTKDMISRKHSKETSVNRNSNRNSGNS